MKNERTIKKLLMAVMICALVGYGAIVFAGAGSGSKPKGSDSKAAQIPPPELNTSALKILMDVNVKMVLLDARGAPFSILPGAHVVGIKPDAKTVSKLVKSKNDLIITYCGKETCPKSKQLTAHILSLGYKNVIRNPQGMEGWLMANYKLVPANK